MLQARRLSGRALGHSVVGPQTTGAEGYPSHFPRQSEGGVLDVGHETGLGPPFGVTHVVAGVPSLAAYLTLGHLIPLVPVLTTRGQFDGRW